MKSYPRKGGLCVIGYSRQVPDTITIIDVTALLNRMHETVS
jgi:hypothetical protein